MLEDKPVKRFYVLSAHEDKPKLAQGSLIPKQRWTYATLETLRLQRVVFRYRIILVATFVLLISAISSIPFSQHLYQNQQLAAAPVVYLGGVDDNQPQPFNYGVQVALSQPDFFSQTLEEFKNSSTTFIAADLSTMTITFYENGVESYQAPILSKGKEGLWWETPAGLYEIGYKNPKHFSSFGNVYQPWSMSFQGNFFIHGWPYYPDGTPVPEGFSGGCIRLKDEDAKVFYGKAVVGTPVLVHEKDFFGDGFLYEPRVPELETPHYLLADIKSSTILASSDLEAVAPIASITKLMTALVAAEHINLDKNVTLYQEEYVTTLVPRLEGRTSVSMYSLLQLLLVESSNEAAEVIASQVGRARFITLMNDKAKALGLENTKFTDPSGLDDENVSCVGDLLRLLQYIYNNRSFILELTANQNLPTAYKSGQFGELENFNQIKDINNFIGGKVGETLAAGQTSVSLHKLTIRGEERVVAIILLGATNRVSDVKELLNYIEERFAN